MMSSREDWSGVGVMSRHSSRVMSWREAWGDGVISWRAGVM